MTDKELLELAAKAAGIEGYVWEDSPFFTGLIRRNSEEGFELQQQTWNPLTDDGDALRLAVKLGVYAKVFSPVDDDEDHYEGFVEVWRTEDEDPLWVGHNIPTNEALTATRRAIVRSAAEIGRNM